MEASIGAIAFITQPASRTNGVATTATFSVLVAGTEPIGYQWFKNGVALTDAGNITGALTPMLGVSNALGGDAGSYRVVVSNLFGSVTSSVAVLTVPDPIITSQPVSQLNKNPSESVSFNVAAAGTAPLIYQWRKSGAPLAGATTSSLILTNLQAADAGYYDVVVSNVFGSVTSTMAVLSVIDPFNPGANYYVYSLAMQADAKVLVGGNFNTLGGQPRKSIGRLNADGTLDTGFNPGPGDSNPYVYSLAVQADGKILVGGNFTTLGGQTRSYLGRLNADGTLDSTFNPGASGDFYPEVHSLVVQVDGKILVGGRFTTLGGQSRSNLGRLSADGTLDSTFNPGASGSYSYVNSLVVQADGKILVGGGFTTLGGQTRNDIGRLNADGTLDTTFNPGASSDVTSMAVQADGKILVGGRFTTLGGQTRNDIGRLNANGTLDSTFNPGASGGTYPYVWSLTVQADGKVLVGGSFTTLGGQSRTNIGRLNADGSLDSGFNPGASATVYSLAVQADGRILVGGAFTTLGGQARNYLGRLNNTEPAIQSISYVGSTITWLRGGTSPEVWRTTFDYSGDGLIWTNLGAGTRISGGWQLVGVSLPQGGTIRGRGYVTGGQYNASGWFVEAYSAAAIFITQPANRTNDAGTTATFSVLVGGTGPFGYQWLRNGMPMADGDRIVGALTSTLAVSNVFGGDTGAGYSVVVSSAQGSVTSALAVLTVRDPFIAAQPATQAKTGGGKEGGPLAGATASSLSLTNLQAADAGYYDVVMSNVFGSVTSAVAVLSVNLATTDSFNAGADSYVESLAVQPDGKILVGGHFSKLSGQPRYSIARVSADGTLDNTFNPGASYDGTVSSLVVQADGKILVGGYFTTLGGQSRTNIGRLNADGTLDSAFNPG
ncbi:MAG: hypothetical protein NT167_27580, partial [Verrucomicrobia bacterium]|nr:hypothetical protein [Verrucomicrobiota bacterium]